MDENTLKLKLTVCTSTSLSLFDFKSKLEYRAKEEMLHCPNNYRGYCMCCDSASLSLVKRLKTPSGPMLQYSIVEPGKPASKSVLEPVIQPARQAFILPSAYSHNHSLACLSHTKLASASHWFSATRQARSRIGHTLC